MDVPTAIAELERYVSELQDVLSRFERNTNSIHIQRNDDERFRQIVLELHAMFNDEFVNPSLHTAPLVGYFNESISNFSGPITVWSASRVSFRLH
jgi:hypothetical protein